MVKERDVTRWSKWPRPKISESGLSAERDESVGDVAVGDVPWPW